MAEETSVKSTAGVEIETRGASFGASSYNAEQRTIDVVWSTGARVKRADKHTQKPYMEVLSMDPKAVRIGRIDSLGMLMDMPRNAEDGTHGMATNQDVLARAVPGTTRIENGRGITTYKFYPDETLTEDARRTMGKIISGGLPVSVGYVKHEVKSERGGDDGLEVRVATDWEPYEVTVLPMPCDEGAEARAAAPELETRIVPQGEKIMPTEPVTIPTAAVAAPAPDLDAVRAQAVADENKRQLEIRAIGEKLDLRAFVEPFLADPKKAVDAVRAAAFEELVKRQAGTVIHGQHAAGTIEAGTDESCKRGAAMTEYFLVRGSVPGAKMTEGAALFRSASLVDCAAECLKATGARIEGLSKAEIARRALKMRSPYRDDLRYRGYQSTSDFPLILEAAAGKTLMAAYAENPGNWMPFCSREDLPDLKDKKSLMFSESPDLETIGEGEEYKYGSFTEGRETWRLYKKGLIVPFTLEAMINDDLGAFTRVQMLQGIAARRGEADVVWAILTANANMADGIALFDVNTHKNFTNGGAAAPSVAEIAKGQLLLRKQKGPKDKARLNLRAKFILVPAALESTVDQLINSTVVPVTAATAITQTVKSLTPIVEARLDDNSATAWYLVSDPTTIDTIHYGYLAGQNGPYTEIKEGFDIDGLEFKIRHFFGAKAIDYRGMYKSTGAA